MIKKSMLSIFSRMQTKHVLGVFAVFVGLTLLTLGYEMYVVVHVRYQQVNQSVVQPFVIRLNPAVSTVNLPSISISPYIEGKWLLKKDILGGKSLTFTAQEGFEPGTNYTVSHLETTHIIGGTSQLGEVHFSTVIAPKVLNTGIMSLASNVTIPPDSTFSIKLAKPNNNIRDLRLSTTPNTPMTMTATANGTVFTWRPQTSLPAGQTVKVNVYDARSRAMVIQKQVFIAAPPKIVSLSNVTNFVPGDVVRITFDKAVDPLASSKIHFGIAGSGKWESPAVYTFTPTTVQAGQSYTYTLDSGIRSLDGGITAQPTSGTLTTFGHVAVTNSGPSGSELDQSSQTISFSFNGSVDHTAAANHFTVSSGTVTTEWWSGTTFMATVVNMGYQKTVTATMSSGIANIGFGLPTNQTYQVTFHTRRQIGVAVQLAYAAAEWDDTNNTTYGNFDSQGGDCANFVSQTLYARGWDMTGNWYNYGPSNWSEPWGYVPAMDAYFSSHAAAYGLELLNSNQRNQYALGDVIVFSWSGAPGAMSQQDHVEIISQITNNNGQIDIKAASHNNYGLYRDLDDQITNLHPGATFHVWHLTRDTN